MSVSVCSFKFDSLIVLVRDKIQSTQLNSLLHYIWFRVLPVEESLKGDGIHGSRGFV